MTLDDRISAFATLGRNLGTMPESELSDWAQQARNENPWFTYDNIKRAIEGVLKFLKEDSLRNWFERYESEARSQKTIAVIAAGNIPLVGFHDFMSVLITGHSLQLKLSSKDQTLMQNVISQLHEIEPKFSQRTQIAEGQISKFDAVIATGSDNSSRYFEYYFGKYPHIIRKNRTSCAVLTGHEQHKDIEQLGQDIFTYFGLGCRSVSKLFLPMGFDPASLLQHWYSYRQAIDHHKYANNYDYQKSILLVNQLPFLDSGFLLMQENTQTVSPIAVLHYEFYNNDEELAGRLQEDSSKLQCIVGSHQLCNVEFGESQSPELWDYADQVDTIRFLSNLD